MSKTEVLCMLDEIAEWVAEHEECDEVEEAETMLSDLYCQIEDCFEDDAPEAPFALIIL